MEITEVSELPGRTGRWLKGEARRRSPGHRGGEGTGRTKLPPRSRKFNFNEDPSVAWARVVEHCKSIVG